MSSERPPEEYGQQPYQQPQPEPQPQPQPYEQPYAPPPMQQPMQQPQAAAAVQEYDWTVTLILSILVGEFGVDRFYTGSIMLGILKLITFGGCGIWWLVDIILIVTGAYKDAYGRPLVRKM